LSKMGPERAVISEPSLVAAIPRNSTGMTLRLPVCREALACLAIQNAHSGASTPTSRRIPVKIHLMRRH
jgi:hypothetical protein